MKRLLLIVAILMAFVLSTASISHQSMAKTNDPPEIEGCTFGGIEGNYYVYYCDYGVIHRPIN
jgi:hypothetical protein